MSLENSPSRDLDVRVIPDKEMPGLLNISSATWERMKKAGDRPIITQLSARRIGIASITSVHGSTVSAGVSRNEPQSHEP